MANNIAVQTELTMLKVAILAAAWKEGEKEPEWVKRDSSGRFSKKSGSGEEGDSVEGEGRSLSDKANKIGKSVSDSIIETLERMGLKHKETLGEKTLDVLSKLSKPGGLSTPEKREDISNQIKDIYNGLEKKWGESSPETKMAFGVLFAVTAAVNLHNVMKLAPTAIEGIKGFDKAAKEMDELSSLLGESMKNGLKDEQFAPFYDRISRMQSSEDTINLGKAWGSNALRHAFVERSSIASKHLIQASESLATSRQELEKLGATLNESLKKQKRSPDRIEKARTEYLLNSIQEAKDNIIRFQKEIDAKRKNLQNIHAAMYKQAKKDALNPDATEVEKDFLKTLEEYIGGLEEEARKSQFGNKVGQDIAKYKGLSQIKNEAKSSLGKIASSIPGITWELIGVVTGVEGSVAAIKAAVKQHSQQ